MLTLQEMKDSSHQRELFKCSFSKWGGGYVHSIKPCEVKQLVSPRHDLIESRSEGDSKEVATVLF